MPTTAKSNSNENRKSQMGAKGRLDFKRILFFVFIFCLIGFCQHSSGQELSITRTERTYKDLYGLDKLKALNRLTDFYKIPVPRKAFKYGKQAVAQGENIFKEANSKLEVSDQQHLLQAYYQFGYVLFEREEYIEARNAFLSAKVISFNIESTEYLDETQSYLRTIATKIDTSEIEQSLFSKTIGNLKVGEAINDASLNIVIQREIKAGESDEKEGDLAGALNHYQKAINLSRDKGDGQGVSRLQLKVAELLDSLQEYSEAQIVLNNAIAELETDFSPTVVQSNKKPDTIAYQSTYIRPTELQQETQKAERENLKDLAERSARDRDFEKSLDYYKMYQEVSLKITSDSLKELVEKRARAGEIKSLIQQKKIADLSVKSIESEKDKQVHLRNSFMALASVVLLASFITLYFYFMKKSENKKLTAAYRDLDATKTKLVKAEQRLSKLFQQQLSADIASELISNTSGTVVQRSFVCMFFLDIRDFTPMAEKMSPEELIEYQNQVFGFMIDVIQKYHGNINQLLGDGFMATFGAPVSHGNDCQNAYLAAKEILFEVNKRNEDGVIRKTRIGIGLHAGNVVAGNVGNDTRKQFSITGNPVIIASRIEQLNKKYNTQMIISEEVYNQLDDRTKPKPSFLEEQIKGRSKPVNILLIE